MDDFKPQLPASDKHLLACRTCHMVLTTGQFVSEGCKTCGSAELNKDDLATATTSKFSGYVGIVDAPNSWVARLIGVATAPAGVYAAHIEDEDEDEGDDDEYDENDEYEDDAAAGDDVADAAPMRTDRTGADEILEVLEQTKRK